MPSCPICGNDLVETTVKTLKCGHEREHPFGAPKIGSAVLDCPVKKGAIWAYITDDSGKGIRGIPVTVSKAPGPKNTDPSGFSSFDPLDPGDDYSVAIGIPSDIEDDYYLPPRKEITGVPVRNGEITSVEFSLERVAPLKVSVQYPENFTGDLKVGVAAGSSAYNPTAPMTTGKGFVVFPKLRRHTYTVNYQLTEEQTKLFAIEGAGSKSWSHNPYGENEVTFKVIALKLTALTVAEAEDLTGDHYWCVVDSVKKVRVTAVTEPNDATWLG
jgi:hypothetical protein